MGRDIKPVFRCIQCHRIYDIDEALYHCPHCGDLLDVVQDLEGLKEIVSREIFEERLGRIHPPYNSGVWRFKELIHPTVEDRLLVTKAYRGVSEGNTPLYKDPRIAEYAGVKNLILKHEGENPSGSFKDYGMAVGVTEARRQGAKRVACASTGNTSSSLAMYAAIAGLECIVMIPKGAVASGKLAQTLAYGAKIFEVEGNFDDALELVVKCTEELGFYLLNSINPWRIEGQKAMMYNLVLQLGWTIPDWVVFPGGNLGNASAFGKAFKELEELGLIDGKPRLAIIQAEGADPLYKTWKEEAEDRIDVEKPETIASAIRIGRPVSWKKALRSLEWCGGVVEEVSDQEIMDAKALIDRCGIGCEPASAASLAGLKKLVEGGVIDPGERIACILTGNLLKDVKSTMDYHSSRIPGLTPRYRNTPVTVKPSVEDVKEHLNIL